MRDVKDPDFNIAVEVIKEYMDLLNKNPIEVHDDKIIHTALQAAAIVAPHFKLMAAESVQQVLYDEYPQIGFTFNTFYNETVKFVADGQSRITNIGTWSVLMSSYMSDVKGTKYVMETGSLGSRMMNAAFGNAGKVREFGKALQTLQPDTRLLSYADHELLARWITRKNGLSDLIQSLAVFLKVTRP